MMTSLEHSPCEAFVAQFQKLKLTFPTLEEEKLKFYPIVDNLVSLQRMLEKGACTIQLRLKNKSMNEIFNDAKEAQVMCDKFGCQFFLNDYWQIAVELNLYGVHLGFEDLQEAPLKLLEKRGLRLGLSTHSYFELATALVLNPSYIALGPIYPTTLKKMRFSPQGLERISEWRNLIPSSIPLVAIGGISVETAKSVFEAGANSIAAVSAAESLLGLL